MPGQRYPEPTTGALIFDREGRLFLMKSHKWKGKWVIPGGHVDLGERIEDAVRREVKEETNLDVYDLEFVCFQEFIHGAGFWRRKHFIFFDYACKTDSTVVVLNEEAEEYRWASLDELEQLKIDTYTWNVVRAYLEKKGLTSEKKRSLKRPLRQEGASATTVSKDLTVRPFLEEDAARVIALWRVVFAKDPPWNEPEETIRRKLQVQRDLFLVGVLDGEIVATAIAGYDGFRGWVYHVAVEEEKRRAGIGRAMMAEVEKRLRAHGCPKINLQVRAWNTETIEFYRRLGYRVEDHTSMGKLLE